jgi:polyisoprenoid-binding protein YceI
VCSLARAAFSAALFAPSVVMAQAVPAASNRWNIDPVHSAVNFRVRHLGITWVNGAFRQWTAEFTYDPAQPESSSVTARIQTASIDTENPRRDADLRQNYLHVDSFPEITFVSRSVETAGPDRLRITGDLTMHGVTRQEVLDTEVGGVFSTPRGRRVAFSATTTLNRSDFGMTFSAIVEGVRVVGDEVRISIDVEATAAPPS